MLRKEAVETGTLDLIKRLMTDSKFGGFSLVGGTALALMIGHRKSIDFDLFTTKSFNSQEIADHLVTTYRAESVQSINNGVFCFVNDVKIDVLAHQYPLVGNLETIEGVRMISLLDIGAMKLNAVYDNGTRLKDFVDLYALLEFLSLQQIIQAFEQKYPDVDSLMVKKAMIYFEDVQFLEPIDYIGEKIKLTTIEERLRNAFHNPHKTFGLSETTKKLMEKNRSEGKRQNKGRKL